MTVPATVIPGGIVWAAATRITPLDNDGNIIPGSDVFVTDQLMKCTITPVNEAGDAIALKNASGNLGVFAVKGDIPKWYTIALELVYPDPQLEALLTGGTLFNDTTAALGAPEAPTIDDSHTTGGSIKAGTYYYGTESYSVFGRTTMSPLASATVTGSVNVLVIEPDFIGAEVGAVVFGRGIGAGYQAQIGTVINFAADECGDITAATVVSIPVTALTQVIPAGQTFEVTGDTNSPPVIFTAAETGTLGQTTLAVESVVVGIDITGALLIPCFVDTGAVVPNGQPNTTDLSGGPGLAVGQQSPVPGFASAQQLSLEFWMERIEEGHQDGTYPWTWIVVPRATYFVIGARDVTNAELQALYTGTAFPNPNWGAGPLGDFPFDSSGLLQWTVCGNDVVPTPSYTPQGAY